MTVTLYNFGVSVSGERGGGGGASSIFRRRSVWLKSLHSIHIKAKPEKHILNMTTIFYLYDCISFNDLPNPTNHFYFTHWLQTDKQY